MNSKIEKQGPGFVGVVGDLFHEHAILAAGFDRGAKVFLGALPGEKQEPVAKVVFSTAHGLSVRALTKTILAEETKLYTAPQPCPECEKLKAEVERLNTAVRLTEEDRDEWKSAASSVQTKWYTDKEILEKLKAKRDELAEQVGQLRAEFGEEYRGESYSALKAKRDELAEQVTHWKANHASVVEQARILKERPDMPIERVKAYESWVAMAAQVEKMRGVIDIAKVYHSLLLHKDRVVPLCEEALALPDLSTGIINRVRAETLRDAVDLVIDLGDDSSTLDARTLTAAAKAIADHALAADMEAGKC